VKKDKIDSEKMYR